MASIVESKIGRALAAHLPRSVRDRVIESHLSRNGRPAPNENGTMTDDEKLVVEMAELREVPKELLPEQVIITPDGNRRFGMKGGISRAEAHRYGAKKANKLLDVFEGLGIKYITFWGLSQKNVEDRDPEEVEDIVAIAKEQLIQRRERLIKAGTRFQLIGRRDRLADIDPEFLELADQLAEDTKDNTTYVFTIAMDYGGRATDEDVRLINNVVSHVNKGDLGEITDERAFELREESISLPRNGVLAFRTGVEEEGISYTSGFGAIMDNAVIYTIRTYFPDTHEVRFADGLLTYTKMEKRKGK